MMAQALDSGRHTLGSLLEGLIGADVLSPSLQGLPVTGLSSDSRRTRPGDLFVAESGLGRPGVDFAPDALEAGAVAVLHDAADAYARERVALLQRQYDQPWIALPDLARHVGEIASRFHHHPSAAYRLIGVTGTDGKTSVTHLLMQALERLEHHPGSIGTLGYVQPGQLVPTGYTTPDALRLQGMLSDLRQQGCDVVVMEVSSHALDQQRVAGCAFDIAALTNLGQDHLDYHGDRDRYAAAKARLFDLPGLSLRVLNLDDPLGRELAMRHAGETVIGYSRRGDEQARIRLVDSSMDRQGLRIRVDCDGEQLEIGSGLVGGFNVENLLACIAILRGLELAPGEIASALQQLQPIPGRMEFFPAAEGRPAVVIDFAHTEQALEACLESLRGFCRGRLFCVFGCGGDRDRGKRPRMAAVAERLADEVIVTDDNPRNESPERIMADILAGFADPQRVRVIHDRQTAIETALAQAAPEDLVLIAGKGHEQVQIVGDRRLPFSDRRVVLRQLEGEA
jgi:UDP-N-acetylmuramoyl-L-alanyl-D-glutamate--2,6-diaminopimelate ligase